MGKLRTDLLAGVLLLLAACSGQQSEPVLVAAAKPPEAEVMYMTALLRDAQISVVDGCLRIIPASSEGPGYLGVFPYGYSLERIGDDYVILDEQGRNWGRTNTSQDLGGGETAAVPADELTPLGQCDGPYWIVGP